MKYTIDHNIEPSVYLWLDNVLIKTNEAFGTYSGAFRYTNTLVSGYASFSSPHRQIVYDDTVVGATVPNGVYVDGIFTPVSLVNVTADLTSITADSSFFTADITSRSLSGIAIDFYRGQALFTGASSQSVVTAAYSYKEVNIYFTQNTEHQVLFENVFVANPRSRPRNDTFNAKDFVYPCIFIKSSAGKNQTLAFDGCSATRIPVRMTVLADSAYLYRAITSILRDKAETFIPILEPSDLPFNKLYSLSSASFDYNTLATSVQQDSNRLAFIKSVNISDFQDRVNNLIGPRVFGGFIDLELELVRFPRS